MINVRYWSWLCRESILQHLRSCTLESCSRVSQFFSFLEVWKYPVQAYGGIIYNLFWSLKRGFWSLELGVWNLEKQQLASEMAEVIPVTELNVVMHCEGCAGAVRKTLRKIPGVQSYTVDYTQQKATVVGTADPETILSAVRKSGKMATLKGQQATQAEAAPQEEKKEEKKGEAKSGEIKEEQSMEEKKQPKPRLSFRETFRSKFPNRPKMTDLRQKMSNLSNLKMQDLQKRMPDICNSMPKNFMSNACREFMNHGVFYVAKDEWSEDEDSVKKT